MRKLTVLATAALSGCVSTLPPSTEVQLTSVTADVAQCQRLGEVSGSGMFGGAMYELGQKEAEAKIMNDAADMGGNTVLLTRSTAGMMGANMAGVAYRC